MLGKIMSGPSDIGVIGSPLAATVMGLVAAQFGHVDPSDGAAVERFFATLASLEPQTQAAIADEVERLCLASETDPAFRSALDAAHEDWTTSEALVDASVGK
jgi:hypothetical protein